jgi:hypothetical protein
MGIPGGSLLRVPLGCCARCFGNDFGPRIDGSRNAFVFYILELGFLLWEWFVKPNMTSIISNAYHNHPEKKRRLFNVLYGCEWVLF